MGLGFRDQDLHLGFGVGYRVEGSGTAFSDRDRGPEQHRGWEREPRERDHVRDRDLLD